MLPNVSWTMIGRKMVDGHLTDEPCVIVAVRRKVGASKLSSSECVPGSLTIGGRKIPTDVVQMGRFVLQAGRFCSDGNTKATVSALAKSAAGPVGITCAHALVGQDGNAMTPDRVGIWDPGSETYVPAGRSGPMMWHPGLGIPSDFGFADIGLFTLEDQPSLQRYARGLGKMRLARSAAFGSAVTAESNHGRLSGHVYGAECVSKEGTYCDLVVSVDGEGTFGGDSGAMWRTASGAALAIHAMGSREPPGVGSHFSMTMFAWRAADGLNVVLLEG